MSLHGFVLMQHSAIRNDNDIFMKLKKRVRKPIGGPNNILLETVHVSRHNSSTFLLKWKNKDRLIRLLSL